MFQARDMCGTNRMLTLMSFSPSAFFLPSPFPGGGSLRQSTYRGLQSRLSMLSWNKEVCGKKFAGI